MTLQKRSLIDDARAKLDNLANTPSPFAYTDPESEPVERALASPTAYLDTTSAIPEQTSTSLSQLVEQYGHAPTNTEYRQAAEQALPPLEQQNLFNAAVDVTKKVIAAPFGVANAAITPAKPALKEGAHLINKYAVSPALAGLNWWSDNIDEPALGAVTGVASIGIDKSKKFLLANLLNRPQEAETTRLAMAYGQALEARRLAGKDISNPLEKLAAFHEGAREYESKLPTPYRLIGEVLVDPTTYIPFGKLPYIARIPAVAAVARSTLRGKHLLPALNASPSGRMALARDVSTDLIDNVARLPLQGASYNPVTADNAAELLNRVKALVGDETSTYTRDQIIPHVTVSRRDIPMADQLNEFQRAMEAGWRGKDGWNFGLLERTLVNTDKPDAAALRSQLLETAMNAYGKQIGYRKPVMQVRVTGQAEAAFPTPLRPTAETAGFVQLPLEKGALPKNWRSKTADAMRDAGGLNIPDVVDVEDIKNLSAWAAKHGLQVETKLVYLGHQLSPLQRLSYGMKKQLSPIFLGLNPYYALANPVQNYSMVFMRHGLDMFKYKDYQRVIKEGQIPLGQFADESFGMSGDAVGKLMREAQESAPWVERIPLLGRVPKASRELQQVIERHAHVVHMTVGYGKALRKIYGNNLESLVKSGQIPHEVYEMARHAQSPDAFARLLKAGQVGGDAADLFPWNNIRDPLTRLHIEGKFKDIREGGPAAIPEGTVLPPDAVPTTMPGRPVTSEDVDAAISEYMRDWAPNGIKRRQLDVDVSTFTSDVSRPAHPLNDDTVSEPEFGVPEKYQTLAGELKSNFAKHIAAQEERRFRARNIVVRIGAAKNDGNMNLILAEMSNEAHKAAILSTRTSDDFYQLIRNAKGPEEYRKHTQDLFRLRSHINEEYTKRTEALAKQYEADTAHMPDMARVANEPPQKQEAAFVKSVLEKYGIGELDPNMPESTIDQLMRHIDDNVNDVQAAHTAWRANISKAAPPAIDPKYHTALSAAFNDAHLTAQNMATMYAQHDLFNYGYKTSLDLAENIFSPYPFWSGRFLLNMGTRMIEKPEQFAQFARVVQQWYNDTKELPPAQWFTIKAITMPGGAQVRFRPWNMLFPLGWPALELIKAGSDPNENIELTDLIQTVQKSLGLTPYPHWELAMGLAMPTQVDASGFGMIREPAEIFRNAFAMERIGKVTLASLGGVDMLDKAHLFSEADINHAINTMREDMHAGRLGTAEQANGAIDSALSEYRKGVMTPFMAYYLTKEFRENELFKQIPSLNFGVFTPEQAAVYKALKNAYQATPDGDAPSQLDKSNLADKAPELYAGGRWKLPANLKMSGRTRQIWEDTRDYQYELSQISERAHAQEAMIANALPEGRGLITPLQTIHDTARIARMQARADHPLAAVTQAQRDELKRNLGGVPTPVNPLDAAYEEYLGILEDPKWINAVDLSVDYRARQEALDAWEAKYANLTGIALDRRMSASEYRDARLHSSDVPLPIQHYYDFLRDARDYFSVVDELPDFLRNAYKSWQADPQGNMFNPLVKLARQQIEQRHHIVRLQKLATEGTKFDEDLQKWLGVTPLWLQNR